jgi:predicted transcriptional regulator YdeE
MEHTKLDAFTVIGLAVKTTNENGQSAKDIGALWQKFMGEGILEKIPNKIDYSVYSVYTEYEGDYTKPYTTVLGYKVSDDSVIPEGMVSVNIKASEYSKYTAKGNLNEGIVYNTWTKIWNNDLKRSYKSDFEVYGEKAKNPIDAEVEIFIGVN